MNIKDFILKNKKLFICLIVSLGIGLFGGYSQMPVSDYNNLITKRDQLDNEILSMDQQLESSKVKVDNLQAQNDEVERLAKEKAEREAKEKEEAEKKAKEKGEAEKLAQAQASQKQTSNDSIATNSANGNNVQTETPVGKMVWLSETGTKYHSINNCGRMNPSKARKVSINEAISQGYGACSKCN